jgi:hypothetical protein
MSIEHSVICDRCGSVVAAASTVDLARADAAQLGARQDAREDLCARCSPSGGASVAPQPRGHRAQPPAFSTSTRRLGDDLADMLAEYVREVVDARIAELSGGVTEPADKAPGSAAEAFSKRMAR